MSTPQDIVAEVLRGQWMPPAEQAAHVVSELTDAGYSIVPSECLTNPQGSRVGEKLRGKPMAEPLDLDAIEARVNAATPGPWAVDHQPNHHPDDPEWSIESWAMRFDDPRGIVDSDGVVQGQADAELIAHSPTDLKLLLNRVEELEAEVNLVRAASDCYIDLENIRGRLNGTAPGDFFVGARTDMHALIAHVNRVRAALAAAATEGEKP